jgi:poly(3-hydroxybutyrate) depolymerase
MRKPASIVSRCFVVVSVTVALSFACSGNSSAPAGDGDAGEGTGGNATTGGSSNGGAASGSGGTAGDSGGSGGTNGTTGGAAGTDASGGADSTGGMSSGGGSAGTTGTGGDAGAPVGGSAGSASGGNGGSAGSAGSTAGSGGLGGDPSTGCLSAQVPTSGRFTLDVSGTEREYILKLPPTYDVTRPRTFPLFILFHGRMYSAETVVEGVAPGMTGPYYGIEAASGGNAILVAAQALSTSWTNEGGRDVAYIQAMLTRFRGSLCFDENRIFAVGFSMGAVMTLTAACDASNPFRAIAPMSASLPSTCSASGPALAYFGSHGTNDTTIRPEQGEAVRDSFVAKNGCSTTTMPGDRAGCVNYTGCDAGAPVTWCSYTGEHEPPPFAGEALWAFFSGL